MKDLLTRALRVEKTMSDAEQNLEVKENEVVQEEKQQELDYKALYEETQKKLETVASHKDKLYQETKKAKAEREAAEKEAKRIAEEKAQKDGEFEKLWQATKQEKETLLQQLQEIQKSNRREKIQISAMKIASELADGDNADLLSEFVVRNLDKMADESGALSVDVLNAVRDEFKSNNKFKSLLRGSKAVGGGAPGNMNSVQKDNKTVDRATFDTWSPHKQMEFMKNGGRWE